jgi:hypothetical protein
MLNGGLYVALVVLWLVVSRHSAGDDACLRPDVRFCVPIPQPWLHRMLRQNAAHSGSFALVNC